jgi:hypothetical protein
MAEVLCIYHEGHVDGARQRVGGDVDGLPFRHLRALHAGEDDGAEWRGCLTFAVERGAARRLKGPSEHLIQLSVEFVGDAGGRCGDDLLARAADLRGKVAGHR